jgi:AsmA protein
VPKTIKYVLIACGALVVLFVLALVVIALTVDPNQFKPQIVKLVQEKKQRTLTVEGDIKLKLFPKLGVDLGRTRLSEHKGAGEFAAVDSVRLYVAWLPLLKKELVVDKIIVQGARAGLVRHADGTTNFDDLLSKEDESQQLKFDIDGVRVAKSALSFDDRMGKRKLSVTGFNLETGRIKDNTHTDIQADFKLAADHPKVAADVDLETGLLFALQEKRYVLDGLNLRVKGEVAGITGLDFGAEGDIDARMQTQEIVLKDIRLDLKGKRAADKLDIALDAPKLLLTQSKAEGAKLTLTAKVEQPRGTLRALLVLPDLSGSTKAFQASQLSLDIDGRQGDNTITGKLTSPFRGSLDAKTFSLPKLAANLDVSNPKLPKGGMKLQLAGSAHANIPKTEARVNLQTRLDDSNIQAKLGVDHFDPAHLDFDVDIDRLDVDRYLPPKAKTAKPEPESPIDLSALKSLNASGRIKVGQLKVANIKSSNVRLDVKAGGGRIEARPLSAHLYQGTMSGMLSATTTANPRIAVQQNLSGISIGPLLRDLADKDLLEGRGNVALHVTAQGQTVSAMKRALDGTAAVDLRDGAIKGVNIAAMLRRAQAALGGTQTQSASATEQTDFSELKASFNIGDGVAHNDDLSAKSPLLRLDGQGDIDIGAGAMDYVVKATLVGSLEGQGGKEVSQLKGVTVPVRISGPFDALKYSLDAKALATEAAKARLEEKKQEVKQKVQEELLKGIFGR